MNFRLISQIGAEIVGFVAFHKKAALHSENPINWTIKLADPVLHIDICVCRFDCNQLCKQFLDYDTFYPTLLNLYSSVLLSRGHILVSFFRTKKI